jgi:hypothetical protein
MDLTENMVLVLRHIGHPYRYQDPFETITGRGGPSAATIQALESRGLIWRQQEWNAPPYALTDEGRKAFREETGHEPR